MPSSHSAAGVLVHQERLFNNLSSFRELEQRIQALHDQNTKAVGDAFEIFIEAYLATQVTFQAEKVWIVGQIPAEIRQQLNLPADTKGIDGVFQTHSGELVPYQVKFRTERGHSQLHRSCPFLSDHRARQGSNTFHQCKSACDRRCEPGCVACGPPRRLRSTKRARITRNRGVVKRAASAQASASADAPPAGGD